jgi:hypothetical protein
MTTNDDSGSGSTTGKPDLDVWRRDASRAEALCADADTLDSWAAMGSAARTGWPRDAARVGVLVERVAALEVALGEALDEFEDAIQYKLDFLVTKHGDRATIARLRAIAAGTAAAAGEEPAR